MDLCRACVGGDDPRGGADWESGGESFGTAREGEDDVADRAAALLQGMRGGDGADDDDPEKRESLRKARRQTAEEERRLRRRRREKASSQPEDIAEEASGLASPTASGDGTMTPRTDGAPDTEQ